MRHDPRVLTWLTQAQEGLRHLDATGINPEARKKQQGGLAHTLLALLVEPEPAERRAALVAYAAALAEEGGDAEAVAQTEALKAEDVPPEEVAATAALLVFPDVPRTPATDAA